MFGANHASSFQAEYQRLVESWVVGYVQLRGQVLSGLAAGQGNEPEDKTADAAENQNVEISTVDSQGHSQLLYGKDEQGNQVCQLTPELIQDLEQSVEAVPGKTVEGLPSLKVKLNETVLFESDRDGRVLSDSTPINQQLEQQPENDSLLLTNLKISVFNPEEQDYELLYGQAGSRQINRITPEQLMQVEQAADFPPGSQVEGISAFKIQADGQLIFHSDDAGNVLVNEGKLPAVIQQLQQPEAEISQSAAKIYEQEYGGYEFSDEESDYTPDYELDEYEEQKLNALVELMVPLVETIPDSVVAPERQQEREEQLYDDFFDAVQPHSQSVIVETIVQPSIESAIDPQLTKSGLDALDESLAQLSDSPLKQVVQGMSSEMRQLEASQAQLAMDELLAERAKEPHHPTWWQQLSTKVETMVEGVRDTFTQYRAASTLKDFAHQVGLQSGESYETTHYQLSREGKQYALSDSEGNLLMRFESGALGVKVDKTLPALEENHFRNTEQLRQDLGNSREPGGAFISQGTAEAQYLQRVNRITQSLAQYASAQPGGNAQVEGKFSYDWRSNAAGAVMIQDKQGNVLLAAGNGHLRSRMDEKDLKHFEQMLPALQCQQQQSRPQLMEME